MTNEIVKAGLGTRFHFGPDEITIKVSSNDSGGTYSLMHWVVAPNAAAPAHTHENYEETFYVLSGELDFLVGEETTTVKTGDFIRAPKGTRHGYTNPTGSQVELLVGFTPGGMEQLFKKYQFEGDDFDEESYLKEALETHKTEYELGT
jgi:quercetin dioxygenase-like cupin family protein